ncbi:MAG TPA: dephospho-CoA kinase [Thermodesulfovibrionia bacterium]|nr:dephospho-CoA kinase [Thermodesulfovibrionia bacterium]
MPYLGLTGNFGTGKSTILSLFNELGAVTISADMLVADILQRQDIIEAVAALLGSDVITEHRTLDKAMVASIIFDEPDKRKRVEAIIHPVVFEEAEQIRFKAKKRNAVIVFEVPLLFEGQYESHFDKTILVYCNAETAIRRLCAKGFSKEESLRRISAQMPIEEKLKKADYIIDNSLSYDNTKRQARELFAVINCMNCD